MAEKIPRFSGDFRPLHSTTRLKQYAKQAVAAVQQPDPARPLVTCPWCPDFDRTDPRHAGISHGMCPACAAKFEAEASR